jgi:hypothetical protein
MVAREVGKYMLDLVDITDSDGRKVTLRGQRIIYFTVEKAMRILSKGKIILYITKSY